eukprot:m.739502 g.739502  ORF g.739502 m.739502 type:complete len:102 (-) comp23107_c0_seq21:247-552(-)
MVGEKVTDNDNQGNTAGEGSDRASIGLPGRQQRIVNIAVASGKPVVVVCVSGGSVTLGNVSRQPNVAMVYAGFGGEMGAQAIVDVLFGTWVPCAQMVRRLF